MLQLLTNRLGQLDAVKRGWVVHGFPKTRVQAENLSRLGYEPNRIIFLDVPMDTIMERLTLRSVDPITGERYVNAYCVSSTVNPHISASLKQGPFFQYKHFSKISTCLK